MPRETGKGLDAVAVVQVRDDGCLGEGAVDGIKSYLGATTGMNWVGIRGEWGRGITPSFRLDQLGRGSEIYRSTGPQERKLFVMRYAVT